ncbi:acyl carrier protein [Mesorhizobium xinjiangense]|uniref:acyl carrier protein n=1 Tax=Mesorhizobium xinjiangense TaxID=2678685 RepID=UPI0012ED611C|nr:acyl carrier protein [Mesorhizobium xinjiangense]
MTDQLEAEIIAKLGQHLDRPNGPIGRDTELGELGIHSLELTEIIFDMEERYGIEVEMDTASAWERMRNVGDIVDAVRGLIQQKS